MKSLIHSTARIHPTAEVSPQATIGAGARIWHQAQVREGAVIGDNCIIGKGAYIDFGVHIGANSKLQNGVFVYHGVTVEEGVFLGPGVILTNDRTPRAINPDGTQMSDADWQVTPTLIQRGASVGARAVILPGMTLGEYSMIGAGSVVTHPVPAYGLVYGNPARMHGYVCGCGAPLFQVNENKYGENKVGESKWQCPKCQHGYQLEAKSKTLYPLADPTEEMMAFATPLRSPSVYHANPAG